MSQLTSLVNRTGIHKFMIWALLFTAIGLGALSILSVVAMIGAFAAQTAVVGVAFCALALVDAVLAVAVLLALAKVVSAEALAGQTPAAAAPK